jgi:Tol biopolymer transport system component
MVRFVEAFGVLANRPERLRLAKYSDRQLCPRGAKTAPWDREPCHHILRTSIGHAREDLPSPSLRFWPVGPYLVIYLGEKQPLEKRIHSKEESDSGKLVTMPAVAAQSAHGAGAYLIGAGIACALALAILAVWYFAYRTPPDTTLHAVPLTSYRGIQTSPSFSPDGNQVAFAWNGEKQDNLDIYIKLIGPGSPLRVTTDPAVDSNPKWSPDGRSIAFLRHSGGAQFRGSLASGKIALMTVAALGGQERKLAEFDGYYFGLSWSPDGKWLAVAARIGAQAVAIYLASVDSGELRKLTNPPSGIFGDVFPAFSRDGHALAFCRLKSMAVSSLYVLPLSANFEARGEPQALPTLAGQTVYSPAWTTDDREIVYSTNVSERSVLYRVAVSGGGPPRPLGLGDGAAMPALSSDGRHLAYAHFSQDVNIWRVDLSGKSAVPEQLIASTSREVFPQFSPDGKRIVFYSNSTGSDQIWLCNADGSNAAPLTSMEAAITGTPRWSPDGRQISFDSNADGFFQVYVIRADGGKPRQLTHERTSNFGASWSRDGRWIYFASQRSGRSEVWKTPSQGGAPVQVTRNGGNAAVESRDGKTLYYSKDTNTLWRKALPDGEETQIAAPLFRFNFAVAENGVYYTTFEDRSPVIVFRDSTTGKVTPILKMAKSPDFGLEVSPDGRLLLFAQLDYSGSDLKLVENFR